ncbi:Exocyst complex component EXO70I [Linum perenne]
MTIDRDQSSVANLVSTCSDLRNLLQTSSKMEDVLRKMDNRFQVIDDNLATTARRIAPLQSLSMASKALHTRINRAVSPAFALLDGFKRSELLQRKLINLSGKLEASERKSKKRMRLLLKYVEYVDELNSTIDSIVQDGEPAIQRLQEVVEFLSRTKATDHFRAHRLRETLVTLKALYETEVDAMKFEGFLDQALLNLQDEYEQILQQLKHQNLGDSKGEDCDGDDDDVPLSSDLGTDLELQILKRISEILCSNDCLDICIDIFVKVRYRRAAKALMRLNPDYLRTYTPEEIDEIEWETLETAISHWIHHFELALKTVFISEKKLSQRVMQGILDGAVWLECFIKIADKIMAVFFRFGEGVARSSKEPQKLFKLLDMFDSLEKIKSEFTAIFEGEAGLDICSRYRELEKLLVHSSSKVFWEFGLQIEGNSDGFPPPQDGSVSKLVRYAINYLKYLATEGYSVPMAKVLQTEHIWKAGILSKPDSDENLLKEAVTNILEALQRNIESKRSRYKDKVLPHIFAMNTYWYIYMRTRNTELGKLLGEQYMKQKYKSIAEESAYLYQKQAWGPLVRLLEAEDVKRTQGNLQQDSGAAVKAKVEVFLKALEATSERHRTSYTIPDAILREQLRGATVKVVVPAYTDFLNNFPRATQMKNFPGPDTIQAMVGRVFNFGEQYPAAAVGEGKLWRRESKDRSGAGGSSIGSVDYEGRGFRRSRSIISSASDHVDG